MNAFDLLKKKIKNKKAVIGIIGLGYVGLPLANLFTKKNFKVVGVDIDEKRIASLIGKKSYITDIKNDELKKMSARSKFVPTSDFSILKKSDVIIICVPTPLRKTQEPDISYIVKAAKEIARIRPIGKLIILESTTYPGTTDEVVLPILEKTGLKLDRDFFLVFSPERVDPSNRKYKTENITKLVGGVTKKSAFLAKNIYGKIIGKVIVVSSSRVAETAKLLENTFRTVNIALVNEISMVCKALKIDVWDVIAAAKTKPFGFMPFYPGPGIGGHCLTTDPIYLGWKAILHGFKSEFIELAQKINSSMPHYVYKMIETALNKKIKGAKIFVLGVAYKKDVNDIRESPALDLIKILKKNGAKVYYSDPFVPYVFINGDKIFSCSINDKVLKMSDCVVITTEHSAFDYRKICRIARMIIDTRGITKQINNLSDNKIIRI